MPRRLIFLDIDGVLTSFAADDQLEPACLQRLDRLCAATAGELVLVSSWRDRYGLAATAAKLAYAGLTTRLDAQAPCLPHLDRASEIGRYLRATPGATFVILDDVPLPPPLRARQVVCDDFVGLQDADVELACRLLEGT